MSPDTHPEPAFFAKNLGPLVVEVREADIARVEADAVANAANDRFWMGSGVAGALKRAGGESIEREAVAQGPKNPGQVVVTGAGRLPARWVLHAAVMGQDLRTDAAILREAARNTLRTADQLGAASLALPAFGTGVGGFPPEDCARILLEEVRAFAPTARALRRVTFALFGRDTTRIFESILKET
jgi:O-acetyl-ADP-ribose deacetylase (regulator of RNase III)